MAKDKELLDIQRNYIVSKSNDMIQKTRYQLSLSEQRAICYICSLIKPQTSDGTYQLEYKFKIKDYAEVCGIDDDNGVLYEKTREMLKELRDKSFYLMQENGTEVLVSWIAKVWATKRSGTVKVRLDEDMIPFLFDLQKKFTAYGLINILKMKSRHSIRLYELLRSYAYQREKTFEVEELKHLLMVDDRESYSNYNLFKNRVLTPALKEINNLTDLDVELKEFRQGQGNKVVSVTFIIEKRDGYYQKMIHEQKME